jgi:hypothetical protein
MSRLAESWDCLQVAFTQAVLGGRPLATDCALIQVVSHAELGLAAK